MSVRLKLAIFISLLFLLTFGSIFLSYNLEKNGEDKLAWVLHTHQVINDTEKLISGLKDAETGQRGYLLTKSPSYLEPYYAGVKFSKEHLEKLQDITGDNFDQQKLLSSIEKMMNAKFEELSTTIGLAESGKFDEALALVLENKGKFFMDQIRTDIHHFNAQENILLEVRKGEFKANRTQFTTLILVGLVSMLFLAVVTFMFLRRNLFSPLSLLLSCTKKMEDGEKLQVDDVIEKDELGNLLSAFFKMNEKVHSKTESLDYKAHHDNLTGLKNRVKLYDELNEAIESAKLKNQQASVFFLDLDNFKQLNDTLGHDIGDLILKETAKRLQAITRSTDSIFRVGGDEFVLIIRDIKDEAQVHTIADEILNRFRKPMLIQDHDIEIYPSIGTAMAPKDTTDSDLIIKYSDIAMYESKRDRKISYRVFNKEMLKGA